MRTPVYVGTSLDGFIARKDGGIEWLTKFESQELGESYREFISSIDAIVVGRGTFETALSFSAWLYVSDVFLLSRTIKLQRKELKDRMTLFSMKPTEILNSLSGW